MAVELQVAQVLVTCLRERDDRALGLLENPIVDANGGLGALMPYYEAAGEDLDGAVELLRHRVDLDTAAAAKEGYRAGPAMTTAEAIDSAFADGLIGKREPYRHASKGDGSLDDAMGEFQETLSVKNAATKQARERVRKLRRPS